MWLFLVAQVAFAHTRECADVFVTGLTAPVRRAEVLARQRFGAHAFTHDGQTHEVFVNPGIPPDGAPNISSVRLYATKGLARATSQQLLALSDAGFAATTVFGLTGREVILDLTEGPNLTAAWTDPAREDLPRAFKDLLDRLESWATKHKMHPHRRGDELRVRGWYRRRRIHFRLRPEHVVIDVLHRRLVIDDVDAG